jgi:alpha-L-rhamnosidase
MKHKLSATISVAALVVAAMAVTVPAASAYPTSDSTAQAPTLLRVNGQASDAIVDSAKPTLSWAPNDSARAEAQTGYETRLSDVPSDHGTSRPQVWDSGRVSSAESAGVAYAGPALQADHTYEWTVRTWNRQGQQSPWSHAERFDAGPMGVQDWSASWLKVADGSLVRRSFNLPKTVVRARLYIGAQGLVEPHLNGAVIDAKQVLNSSVTDYAKRVVYRDYDVTDLLRQGTNALAVMVGQGQASGSPTFIAQLSITFSDGSRSAVATDDQWRSAAGPVTRDDFYYGESWDARKQMASSIGRRNTPSDARCCACGRRRN